jgi:uncharacterized membrane protein YoaK (UPF0700 family)
MPYAPDPQRRLRDVSLLLTLVAGFCDTVTFVAADSLFSAHVTGNFIVFAYDVSHGVDGEARTKLCSFPVFVAAVAAGHWARNSRRRRYHLLLLEAALLVLAGVLALLWATPHGAVLQVAALLVVFAMGLQNAFGRLFAKETYGPTTVMTGNVTQATLDLMHRITTANAPAPAVPLSRQLLVIGAFLLGCLLGAVSARWAGLSVVAGAGALLLALALGWHRQAQQEAEAA